MLKLYAYSLSSVTYETAPWAEEKTLISCDLPVAAHWGMFVLLVKSFCPRLLLRLFLCRFELAGLAALYHAWNHILQQKEWALVCLILSYYVWWTHQACWKLPVTYKSYFRESTIWLMNWIQSAAAFLTDNSIKHVYIFPTSSLVQSLWWVSFWLQF